MGGANPLGLSQERFENQGQPSPERKLVQTVSESEKPGRHFAKLSRTAWVQCGLRFKVRSWRARHRDDIASPGTMRDLECLYWIQTTVSRDSLHKRLNARERKYVTPSDGDSRIMAKNSS